MDTRASRLSWRRLPWTAEVVSIGLGYGVYSLIRVLAAKHVDSAYGHAQDVGEVERALGIYHERWLNAQLSGHTSLELLSSYYYSTLHFIVTPVVLAWLWRRRARFYPVLRSGLVVASACALVIYAAWPLAPPRFAVAGTVDTVIDHPVIWVSGDGAGAFVNDLAAMPSLHVGWAVWCAIAIVAGFRSRARHLAWLYPVTTTLVVVATANHYLLDALGGALVVVIPLIACGLRPSTFRVPLHHPHPESPQVVEAVAVPVA
ncbi:MAG: phosphatase PAP2 family protein [Mycobacteriales bacterium]